MTATRTLCIIKPDAFNKKQFIREHIVGRGGFKILVEKEFQLSAAQIDQLYAEHVGKDWYAEHAKHMGSGPCTAWLIDADPAKFRAFVGHTNPSQAAPLTLRKLFGKGMPMNAVHASDAASAEKEIAMIFGGGLEATPMPPAEEPNEGEDDDEEILDSEFSA